MISTDLRLPSYPNSFVVYIEKSYLEWEKSPSIDIERELEEEVLKQLFKELKQYVKIEKRSKEVFNLIRVSIRITL